MWNSRYKTSPYTCTPKAYCIFDVCCTVSLGHNLLTSFISKLSQVYTQANTHGEVAKIQPPCYQCYAVRTRIRRRSLTSNYDFKFSNEVTIIIKYTVNIVLKGVFAKNERGYRLNAIKKRFWSPLIGLLSGRLIPNNLAPIQIQKIATYYLDHKKSI